ncbi:CerR family C-terminal domain-containing protein [soil metagenome]
MSSEVATPDAKDRLLQAAVEVFAEKGFKAATVREIVEKAGTNIAGVNYHFGDKDRLYIEACKHAHACSAKLTPPPSWPEGTPPSVKLSQFIHGMVHSMTVPTSVVAMQLMMREMANPTAAAKQIVHDYIQPMAFALRNILREMLPGHNEQRLLMIGFSVIGQCLFYRQNRNVADLIFGDGTIDGLRPEAIAEHVERFTLAALGQVKPIAVMEETP